VVWFSAGTRYLVWNGWTEGTANYRLYFRKGTGTASVTPLGAAPWIPDERTITVRDTGARDIGSQR
jgi:hypothetical protein